MRPNSPAMMARVAHGLLRIKNRKLLDLNFIKELLDKVVKLTPNNAMVYHDLGLYYEKYKNVSRGDCCTFWITFYALCLQISITTLFYDSQFIVCKYYLTIVFTNNKHQEKKVLLK